MLFEGDLVAFIRGDKPFQDPAFSDTIEEEFSSLDRLKQAIGVALQAAEGLEFVHKKERVHKDVKPKNFVVRRGVKEKDQFEWNCKITDLGFSRRIVEGSSCCDPTTHHGTKDWIAPELLKVEKDQQQDDDASADDSINPSNMTSFFKLPFSVKSDVWAFGCVLHFIFVKGQHPYGNTEKQRLKRILSGELMECGQQVLDQISQPERFEVKKLIDKMIHGDKDQRSPMTEVVKV